MRPDEVRSLYGGDYADRYDALWEESDVWAAEAGHYVRSISEQLHERTRWLDVGCGTGWFLSQFPGVARAGVDISPSMLAHATEANPDALFLRQGDIREDVPEWHDAWDLVTSTGQAWGYVTSIDEVARVAENMARWTSPGGVCFVQPGDITDLTGLVIPYNFTGETPPNNTTVITGAIWSYYDEGGVHENQVWPSLDVWVQWLSRHFARIDVVTWPHDPPYPYLQAPRRLVLASAKRSVGQDQPAEIVVHPPQVSQSDRALPSEGAPSAGPAPDATPLEHIAEVSSVGHVGHIESGAYVAHVESAGHFAHVDHVGSAATVEHVVSALHIDHVVSIGHIEHIGSIGHVDVGAPAPAAIAPAPDATGRLPGRKLYDQPLSYLVGRLRPWSPRFWRSVSRRARRR